MGTTSIVIGAGIAGLATAKALAEKKHRVIVIERSRPVVGASVRNFGMVWPIGQPDGELYDAAKRSAEIWKAVCDAAGIWYDPVGSLHVAHNELEWQVLQQLMQQYKHRQYRLLTPEQVLGVSPFVNKENLLGGLLSSEELIVDPRVAIRAIPDFLTQSFGVSFIWDTLATAISGNCVIAGNKRYEADNIFICSGADFETLYPEHYKQLPITRCRLQMMRMQLPLAESRIGPALCGGLSLIHYNSFKAAESWPLLKNYYENELAGYLQWGIHVMASQNKEGLLTVGDSHEYGWHQEPFDKAFINDMITAYLEKFSNFNAAITETWNGIYPKMTDGSSYHIHMPEQGVTIINGFGGAGMTLAFGVCEKYINQAF